MLKEEFDEMKKFLKEYEIYVDDKGMAHDDEGNSYYAGTGYSGGTYGLHNAPGFPSRPRGGNSRRSAKTPEEKAYDFAAKLGVDKKDVERYIKDAMKKNKKDPWGAVFNRIKYKSKKK